MRRARVCRAHQCHTMSRCAATMRDGSRHPKRTPAYLCSRAALCPWHWVAVGREPIAMQCVRVTQWRRHAAVGDVSVTATQKQVSGASHSVQAEARSLYPETCPGHVWVAMTSASQSPLSNDAVTECTGQTKSLWAHGSPSNNREQSQGRARRRRSRPGL